MILIALPLVLILFALFRGTGSADQLYLYLLSKEAILNTFLLCFFVGLFAILIGVSSAWLVSRYQFPMSKIFSWALLLPLTIPVYIMAYSYSGIFNYAGPVQVFLRSNFGEASAKAMYFDFLSFPFLVFCFVMALFPYVFISSRVSFSLNSNSYLEAGKSLGISAKKLFFKIALPLARPAIVAGVFLVIMELLNDYGAANYFGIRTFTTAIFQAWSFDLNSALVLAAIVLIFVFVLMMLERWSRGKARYNNSKNVNPIVKEKLKGGKAFLAFMVCFIPLFFGFIVPVLFLFSWFIETAPQIMNSRFFDMTWNSFLLAAISAAVVVLIGIIIAYNKQVHQTKIGKFIAGFSTIGYAIPGAVIAVAVLVPAGALDNWLSSGQETKSLLLSGSIFLMIYAYSIRFLAVAYQPLENSFEKNSKLYRESSRSLGKNAWQTLFKVELPIIHPAIWAAAILVFVDVLKELPLTLILRPFNFDTLATETYRYAKIMESVPESSSSALIIIFMGMIPILFLNRLIKVNG